MSSAYVVTQMAPGGKEQSYPFLYGAAPSATLQSWQRFCEGMRGGDQKLLVARTADGYIQGLCTYFETEHLSRGRLLDVPFFLVASAADPQGVADDLVRALTRICAENGCAAVRVAVPPRGGTDPSLLSSGERGNDDAIYFAPSTSEGTPVAERRMR